MSLKTVKFIENVLIFGFLFFFASSHLNHLIKQETVLLQEHIAKVAATNR